VTPLEIGLIMIGAMLVLIILGTHIGIALAVLSFVGVWWIKSNAVIASKLLALTATDFLANYFFGVVPLFVLMALVVNVSGIGRDTFDVAQHLLARVRGGVGIATVAANAVFAAITGISVASAAMFTKVAVPEMMRLGYSPKFAVGTVAGSSVLGMLIPPSLLLIIYGILTESSIGDLFLAGIGPGILLAFAFMLGVFLMAVFRPSYVGEGVRGGGLDHSETVMSSILKLSPSAILIAVVLGGIYGGIFTTTEAAAAGAAASLLFAAAMRRITWKQLWQVLIETGHISVSILFLILCASFYSKMLTFSGVTQAVVGMVAGAGFGLYGFLVLYVIVLIALGMILDSVSILLIVVPLILPAVANFGIDLIWFGIITVVAVEIGLLTPPFGLSVYVIESTLGDKNVGLREIFAGAFPFVVIMLFVLAILIAVPQISLVFI
jgi:tripartite ATP-independent transporter DctM subunit